MKGLALIPNNHNCEDVDALGGTWFYNWGPDAADCINNGVNIVIFVPKKFLERIYSYDLGSIQY